MNDESNIKKKGFSINLFLLLSLAIFVFIGGFSIYKIIIHKPTDINKLNTLPTPTTDTNTKKSNDLAFSQSTPTPPVQTTPSPLFIPTKIPTLSITSKPSPSITPVPFTPTLRDNPSSSPTPTDEAGNNLPVSGYTLPTVILITLGSFLLLPAIFLL